MNYRNMAIKLYNDLLNEKIELDNIDYSDEELDRMNIDLYNRRIDIIIDLLRKITIIK
jgi:hypothetical protein